MRSTYVLGGMLLVSCATVTAQDTPRRGLAPGIGFTSTTATGVTGATVGMRATLMGMRPRGIVLDFGLGYLVPSRTNQVFRRYGAVVTDIGLAYVLPLAVTRLVFGAGGSFLLNANGSADGAPYLKLGAIHQLSDRVGIRADLVGRYWFDRQGLGAGVDLGLLWLPGTKEPEVIDAFSGPSFDGWMFGAAANLLAVSQDDWDVTLWGPAALAARVSAGGVGFETALSYIVPTGSYDLTGLSLDLGLVYAVSIRQSSLILFRAGGTVLVGGDSDGSGGAAGAIYPGVGFLHRLAGQLALRVDVTPRIWVSEETLLTFGGSAGLVLLTS